MAIENMATGLLLETFGDIWNNELTAVTKILEWVSTSAIVAAGLVLTYAVFVGVVNTAKDGEVLGRKWSSVWVPFRMAIGLGMLIPISTMSGLSSAQVGIVWALAESSKLADNAWEATVDALAVAPVLHTPTPGVRDVALDILRAQSCAYAIAYALTPPGAAAPADPGIATYARSGITLQDGTSPDDYVSRETIAWPGEIAAAYGLGPDVCGKVSYPTWIHMGSPAGGAPTFAADAELRMRSDVYAGNSAAITRLITALMPLAKEAGFNQHDPDVAAFESAVQVFAQQLKSTASSAADAHMPQAITDFQAQSKEAGWVSFGSWYWSISRIQATVSELVTGNSIESSGAWIAETTAESVETVVMDAQKRISDAISGEATRTSFGGPPPTERDEDGDSSLLSDLAQALDAEIRTMRGANPLAQMASLGNTMLGIAGAGSIVSLLSPGAALLAGAAVTLGLTLAFVVPAIPFVTAMLGIAGWLIAAAQAVILAQVWMLGLAHPDGDEIAGMGKAGFMHLFVLLARPVLMVAAMILAYSVFMAMSKIIQDTYWMAIAGSDGSVGTGLWTIFGSLAVYASLIIALAKMCFGLVTALPNTAATWLGGYASGHGEHEAVGSAQGGMGAASHGAAGVANTPVVSPKIAGMAGAGLKSGASAIGSRLRR